MRKNPPFRSIAIHLPSQPSTDPVPVSGGCIHSCHRWGAYFLKINSSDHEETFRTEANGLRAIARSETIRVPEVVALGRSEDTAFLVLEHLDLVPSGDDALLGEQLAALHRHTADRYGFDEDNFIGATPQPNAWHGDWACFFRECRLGHLLTLLKDRGVTFSHADRLLDRLPELLPRDPDASLLHGDLWGGNRAFLPDGTPVIFDPACYHGDPACDLAMTTLFGGFGPRFREAYRSASDGDDPALHPLYNLYHILNHALLFGGGYLGQAEGIIRRFA